MNPPRSAPLILRRAEARALAARIKERSGELQAGDLDGLRELSAMREELAAIRQEIRDWFAPGPDDVPLFGE